MLTSAERAAPSRATGRLRLLPGLWPSGIGDVAEPPGGVAVDLVQQLVRFPREPEPLLVYLAAPAALVHQVQCAARGDARRDVAGDIGVVSADQLSLRAHHHAEQRQQDQIDAENHE